MMNTDNLSDAALVFLFSDAVDGIGIRVSAKTAKKWLLENKKLVLNDGVSFYLRIENLGMGVYKVTKAPLNIRETLMTKKRKN